MEPEQAVQQQIGRITLLADGEYLGAALSFIREAAGRLGLTASDLTALVRAIEEVSLNVIEHAFEPGRPATFDIVLPSQSSWMVEVEFRPEVDGRVVTVPGPRPTMSRAAPLDVETWQHRMPEFRASVPPWRQL